MQLQTKIAGISLEHPVMNAAGTCKRFEGQEGAGELINSSAAAVVIGSITCDFRTGNEGEVYYAGDTIYSLNSLGLPNPGLPYLKEHLGKILRVAHEAGKPLIVSVAGFDPTEYARLASVALIVGVDLVELNLGCPNVWESGKQKRIASFDPELVGVILDLVSRAIENVGAEPLLAVKVSPFSDPYTLEEVATVIKSSGIVRALVTTNTFPNGFACDAHGKSRITPGKGLAGIGGPAMKPIGLGQVRQWRDLLPREIDIVGVGGISTGQDVLDYLHAGAAAVQVATAYLEKGKRIFQGILTELVELGGESSSV